MTLSLLDRLARRSIYTATGCVEWVGSTNGNGYGKVKVGSRVDGTRRDLYVHRAAYELLVGPIPDGLHLDHLCRCRRCWNPFHLEPVTQRENLLRGDTIPAANHAKTTCIRGHAFDWIDPQGSRRCLTCKREASRQRRLRLSVAPSAAQQVVAS